MLDCISSFFCIFETDMFFKCQSLSKLADIFLSNEEFLFKQIDTFRENLVFLWNKKPRFLKD